MTERERESKKQKLHTAEGCQWTFSCFFGMFLHIHRCLVAPCTPKLGVSASHMKEHGVFLRMILHQNVSCMKCGVPQILALLSATLGLQSFSLSSSPLAASFSNVFWIWIFILKEVRWLLVHLSPFVCTSSLL